MCINRRQLDNFSVYGGVLPPVQILKMTIKHTGLHGPDLLGLTRASVMVIREDPVDENAYPNTVCALPLYLPQNPT